MKKIILFATMYTAFCSVVTAGIDRSALLERNSPHITAVDTLASLSVGNGAFAFTTDITGLQTFPEYYSNGVPLGTQSQWGWHSFDNPDSLRIEESYRVYDFGHGYPEVYAAEHKNPGRQKDAATWFRVNPHRLHLGCIGLLLPKGTSPSDISHPSQRLVLEEGRIESSFDVNGRHYSVRTVCHPDIDMVSARIVSDSACSAGIVLRFPFPTGQHADDACDWRDSLLHTTDVVANLDNGAVIKRKVGSSIYYVFLSWEQPAEVVSEGANTLSLVAKGNTLDFTALFTENFPIGETPGVVATESASAQAWRTFWNKGGIVDFSQCPDPRARELERRVVLSQYLLAIQCAGDTPPQETGLTYNSWFGKYHMEMIWWHQAWLPLFGHPEMLERTLSWYERAYPKAVEIASRQGFRGCRWMKMTDPGGEESPSKVGSFLIWQQPHIIYLCSLLQRSDPAGDVAQRFGQLIDATAEFMADFALDKDGYVKLQGYIPAQETLKAETTFNSPMELSYWYFGLKEANRLREARGLSRIAVWDSIASNLPRLAADSVGRYLAAESAPETFSTLRLISDHPAMLGAFGMLPGNPLTDTDKMNVTLDWVLKNWNWSKTWGWDYPLTAMCAARCGKPEQALEALMKETGKNTYLPNGHNFQDSRLRCYLPGNGGLLTAIALMCAGWDGEERLNPGFPDSWPVRWEGIAPLP